MKKQLRKMFWPILKPFEEAEGQFVYKPSHRKVLVAVGVLFSVLAAGSLFGVVMTDSWGAILPVLIFFTAAVVCEVVALLGSDRAVAKIWNSRH